LGQGVLCQNHEMIADRRESNEHGYLEPFMGHVLCGREQRLPSP
jgi:hypothetical protein